MRRSARGTLQRSAANFTLAALAVGMACGCSDSAPTAEPAERLAPNVERVGFLTHPNLTESSGVVASRRFPGVLWTHNDGGGKQAALYAINRAGQTLAEFQVEGPKIADWEDIAIDDQHHLFLGDIGNNDAKRKDVEVYQIDEPDPNSAQRVVPITREWKLRYPKKAFDCESLFVWQGHGYIVSKVFDDQQAEIFRFPLAVQGKDVALERVARLPITSPVTGADLSTDGKQLGLVAKSGAFVFRVDGDIARAQGVPAFHRPFRGGQIEACCFVPEGLLTTSEDRQMFLFTDPPFRPARDRGDSGKRSATPR